MSIMTMDDTGLDTAGTRSHALVHARIICDATCDTCSATRR